MDKRAINIQLNMLKDRNPGQAALIEGVQTLFNKKVEVATPEQKKSLLMFPMQYAAYRINDRNSAEWTTQLHRWADNLLDTLLLIDPIYLTTRDSAGDTVLHRLIKAAVGEYTEQVDYDFIQKILDKDMGFVALQMPFDNAGATAGNAWMMKDIDGNTPMDLLAEFAMGMPAAGMPADDRLIIMLNEFCNRPEPEIDVGHGVVPAPEPTEGNPENPEEPPKPAPAGTRTSPDAEPVAAEPDPQVGAEDEKKPEDAKHHPAPEDRPQSTIPSKVSKSLLETLLSL